VTRINIRYVQAFVDRHGKVRHYYLRHGYPRAPLPGAPGSEEFMDAYRAALAGVAREPAKTNAAKTLLPGTVNAAIIGFYQSSTFRVMRPTTKDGYRIFLEALRAKHGDKRIAFMGRKHVMDLLAEKAGKPGAQHNALHMIRALLAFAVDAGIRPDNPADGIKLKAIKSDGHHSWSDAEIARFEAHHQIGSRARLAFALFLYTAQRRADVVVMGRQHVRDGELHITQSKTGVSLTIPIHEELAAIIAATPMQSMTFISTQYGRPFNLEAFGMWFREQCDAAGLPRNCAAHGLRKAACRRLAEAGCSVHEIMSISGHRTLKEVARYTAAADQARMARSAMASISTNREQTGVKPNRKV
jgi:integrase